MEIFVAEDDVAIEGAAVHRAFIVDGAPALQQASLRTNAFDPDKVLV